ncbi:crocetin glucosyltransferase, chloroplastic-like [Cynara cardunculus var. scolymus]|uniref:Glycosyltransferase n=1 Tax=Cynara cardunculus var. scolymus TaxID=59895 RepID=A0A124R631_CYNCS|nr:crocetin glucosyltransferase, chloroplastic-like [Cynara cardunculus var. scolymus]KVG50686.1 UDP-glucuronosyl/UDP-glucosyltransferase [Cynara cardunculus var. scolymus]
MTGHRKILIVAYPAQGLLNPSLRFAKRLLNMGVDVTYSTSLSAIRCIDEKTTPHGLTFSPFSDGHDSGQQPDTTLQQFVSDFATNGASAVAEILSFATAAGQPFDHLVYTTVAPWAALVADAHGIQSTVLWCQSATAMDIYYYYFDGYQGLISSNNNNPIFPINFPGLPPLIIADLPSFFLPSNANENHFVISLLKDHVDALKLSPTILVNSFNELEPESIRAIEKLVFLPIGPLVPSEFLDGKESLNNSSGEDFIKIPAEDDYIQWLNTKPKSSVVYVSFGTLATLSMDQIEEVASGQLECRRPFLWVIRDSLSAERLSKIDLLKKQGMIVNWCSQAKVLCDEAIGCFLTHGGWNSTVEAVVGGVPMVVFPQWADQAKNGKMIEDVWRTGVRVRKREGDGMGEGREIERCLKMVMGDEKMKRNAEKWRNLAREALNNGGSSTINLQAFLDDL